MEKFLIIGLGNPGPQYMHTRHNAGFDVVEAFALKHGGQFRPARLADVAEVSWKGRQFVCIRPTTFMNLSGKAFRYWMDKEKVELARTLTVLDDLALPLSRIRLRPGGSAGGHNGLKDIEQVMGTSEYPRLRFGIGNSYPKGMQADFVLAKWFPEERTQVLRKIHACAEVIEQFAAIGLERTMNEVNKMEFV